MFFVYSKFRSERGVRNGGNTLFFLCIARRTHLLADPMNNILDDLKFCEVAIKSVANIFKNRKLFITHAI